MSFDYGVTQKLPDSYDYQFYDGYTLAGDGTLGTLGNPDGGEICSFSFRGHDSVRARCYFTVDYSEAKEWYYLKKETNASCLIPYISGDIEEVADKEGIYKVYYGRTVHVSADSTNSSCKLSAVTVSNGTYSKTITGGSFIVNDDLINLLELSGSGDTIEVTFMKE
ncbi:MAG: hypothetical protein J6A09_04915, partial [Alphaproteobacteria bacterium]|nr:hypothetical protein [Alphaproteobacteria bacterium]